MIRRIMLFISSYIPLYILLIVKNVLERNTNDGRLDFEEARFEYLFNEVNDFAIAGCILLIVTSFIYLKKLTGKHGNTHYYDIIDIEDQTGSLYLNYISIYLLPCLGMSLDSIVDIVVLTFLMILFGYIHISHKMTYLNPVLQCMGYKIYKGTLKSKSTKEEIKSIIIANKNTFIDLNRTYIGSDAQDFILITNELNSLEV